MNTSVVHPVESRLPTIAVTSMSIEELRTTAETWEAEIESTRQEMRRLQQASHAAHPDAEMNAFLASMGCDVTAIRSLIRRKEAIGR